MTKYQGSKAVEYLNDQYWHDSILYEIKIIRAQSADKVLVSLNLIVDEEDWKSKQTTLVFNECYYIETKMNGGIECMSDGEMISTASATLQGKRLDQVIETWKKFELKTKELFQFSMSLASTGSEFIVVCKSFNIVIGKETLKHNAPPPIAPTR
ncbi:MAG: hypothetical protein GY705_17780 [Bacteroidetes bacterium]|nr:hypothetical protein [Bacteroidota bacterium]